MTDGRGGDFSGAYDPIEYMLLREKEATEACQILGIHEFHFLRFTDRKLGHHLNHFDRTKEASNTAVAAAMASGLVLGCRTSSTSGEGGSEPLR
jgi:LmbE family N-acetylglucosaminyl deacetylase